MKIALMVIIIGCELLLLLRSGLLHNWDSFWGWVVAIMFTVYSFSADLN